MNDNNIVVDANNNDDDDDKNNKTKKLHNTNTTMSYAKQHFSALFLAETAERESVGGRLEEWLSLVRV